MRATTQLPKSMAKPAPEFPQTAHFKLSKRDVERLLTEDTEDVRIDILRQVAEVHMQRKYSIKELAVAEQILRLLVRDTEVSVREALALALKDNPHIPHDIIIALTRDVEAVAVPVIESSSVLTDADLLSLIQSTQHIAKPTAIARRKILSKEVSAALVGTHNMQIVVQLMKNPEAPLPEEMLQTILRDYGRNKDMMDILAQRSDLPVTIVEKIIALVSDTLAENLRVQYNISASSIASETEKVREVATLRLVDGSVSSRDIDKLIDQLLVFGRLTPSIILSSLCRGNLYFFEASLARLSNIPVRNAQVLIHDKGGLGFKALYTKAALPEKFFQACKLLLQVVGGMQRPGNNASPTTYANVLAQTLLARAAGQKIENLSYIIALIRQLT